MKVHRDLRCRVSFLSIDAARLNMLYDSHCHLYEFDEGSIEEFTKEIVIVAVSDDYESSLRTLELSDKFKNVIPCVGIHPWNAHRVSLDDLRKIERIMSDVDCVGEIGLDRKFTPQTLPVQEDLFRAMLRLAREYGTVVNVHAPDAWRQVVDLLDRFEIDRAVIHWYTGPLDLVDRLRDMGFYISINVALKVQEKSRKIASEAPLDVILLESDGPYEYRGLSLKPSMLGEAVSMIAEYRGISRDELIERIEYNFKRVFRFK